MSAVGIPQPVSAIVIVTKPFSAFAVTLIVPPASVYLKELSSMFTNTCLIRFGSPVIGAGTSETLYNSSLPSRIERSLKTNTASSSSAKTSMDDIRIVKLPFSILEKSRSSSTRLVSRSDSLIMTLSPRFVRASSFIGSSSIVSPHPFIAVSGVRSSCDTVEINSFFIRSLSFISCAILFMDSQS